MLMLILNFQIMSLQVLASVSASQPHLHLCPKILTLECFRLVLNVNETLTLLYYAGYLTVTILLLTFPHSFSLYTLCMLLPHAYYFLFTFLFPSTDFLFFHAQPYCLCVASCTVRLLMHSPAQSAY